MSVSAESAATPAANINGAAVRPARTALATVCISGTLEDKLAAAAAAGFDGVEIFEPDLVASPLSPAQLRTRCAELGLSIDLYQPFRDFDAADPDLLAANLRRAERKFDIMQALGTDLILVCSSVSPAALDDDDRIAEQLHTLATRAADRGLRVSYEALAWGRYVNTYERSWEIVRRADHPALGLCVDSFHILSRGSDPAGIRDIPGDKLFFLQLADAPHMDMDILQWSRHYRLFPGQGAWDLPAFLGHVLTAGYSGPLSLEVFNDVFRQSDPRRSAVDALRSLLALQEATLSGLDEPTRQRVSVAAPPPTPRLGGYAFTELTVDDDGVVAAALRALGFAHDRAAPVQAGAAVAAGRARGCCSTRRTPARTARRSPRWASRRPTRAGRSAGPRRCWPRCCRGPAGRPRRTSPRWPPRTAPRSSSSARPTDPAGWLADFASAEPDPTAGAGTGITGVDHVALTQPFDRFDEAALFYRSVLGLQTQHSSEVAAPFGLVRNRAVADPAADDPAVPVGLGAAPRLGVAAGGARPAARGLLDRRHPGHGAGRPGGRRAAGRGAGQLLRRSGRPARAWTRSGWPRCASSACCWTGTRTASSCTSTPTCWAGGCSSRWCSGSAATPGTARSTPRSGWPRTAGSGSAARAAGEQVQAMSESGR